MLERPPGHLAFSLRVRGDSGLTVAPGPLSSIKQNRMVKGSWVMRFTLSLVSTWTGIHTSAWGAGSPVGLSLPQMLPSLRKSQVPPALPGDQTDQANVRRANEGRETGFSAAWPRREGQRPPFSHKSTGPGHRHSTLGRRWEPPLPSLPPRPCRPPPRPRGSGGHSPMLQQ